MRELHPQGFVDRYPGSRIHRTVLTSIGPGHTICADGHEKTGAQAFAWVGWDGIAIDFYGLRDKWSGYIVSCVALPDARDPDEVAHVYLDMIVTLDCLLSPLFLCLS